VYVEKNFSNQCPGYSVKNIKSKNNISCDNRCCISAKDHLLIQHNSFDLLPIWNLI